eukprot:TRINITY_DN4274_c0_g1_i1.p1 TRINITY_DN4274_c0_g1~~TRINITY_DN4274_c0_g1_i1.p1  ORF type:complete len:218 (-),score=-38.31 TRINITY_DN4274_c0_g1_i1:559-1212(-)
MCIRDRFYTTKVSVWCPHKSNNEIIVSSISQTCTHVLIALSISFYRDSIDCHLPHSFFSRFFTCLLILFFLDFLSLSPPVSVSSTPSLFPTPTATSCQFSCPFSLSLSLSLSHLSLIFSHTHAPLFSFQNSVRPSNQPMQSVPVMPTSGLLRRPPLAFLSLGACVRPVVCGVQGLLRAVLCAQQPVCHIFATLFSASCFWRILHNEGLRLVPAQVQQ